MLNSGFLLVVTCARKLTNHRRNVISKKPRETKRHGKGSTPFHVSDAILLERGGRGGGGEHGKNDSKCMGKVKRSICNNL